MTASEQKHQSSERQNCRAQLPAAEGALGPRHSTAFDVRQLMLIRLQAVGLSARLPLICMVNFIFPDLEFRLGLC